MACLYVSPKGISWRKHSYSAGSVYDQSPFKYYLQKVLGWREKDTLARFQFGKAIEETVQYHHEHYGQGTREFFDRRWQLEKDRQLKYTDVEKDWQTLLLDGDELIQLYILKQPSLPIPMGGQTLFQREYEKEVFQGHPVYGEIVDCGKLDIISYVSPDHPMLPKLNWKPEYGAFRPLIVDMKAMGRDLPETYGIVAFDAQLRRYSWLSGIRDVALLGFIKKSRGIKKGSSVTLLKSVGNYQAGQEAVVAKIPTLDNPSLFLVHNDFMIEEMEKAQGRKKNGKLNTTKLAKQRLGTWLSEFGCKVQPGDITKQRLQFNAGFVTQESANDAGLIAAQQIVSIVNSWNTRQYPNKGSIRYPNDSLNDPYFRAFVLGDEAFRDENFTKTDEDSLDDLFGEVEDGD